MKKRKITKQDLEKFIFEAFKNEQLNDNLIQLFYIKDNKGVTSILTDPNEAEKVLKRHNKYFSNHRGVGIINTKKVLKKDYDDEKITIHNIENYKLPDTELSLGENQPATTPTTKPAPTTTPGKERAPNPFKIPKPGTFPKPNPKALTKNENTEIKAENILKEWNKTIQLEKEKNRMRELMQEMPLNVEPGEHQPHRSIKQGIEGQKETPFSAVELFSKIRLDQSTIEKLGSEEFRDIVLHIGEEGVGNMSPMEIMNALQMIVTYEMRNRASLENLAKEIVKRKFGLSDEIMQMIDAKLKNPGEIDAPDDEDDTPQDEVEQQFTDEELEIIKKHVDKRVINNTLMMGAGYRAHQIFDGLKNSLDGIDERLYPLYQKMMPNVELFMWKMPVEEMYDQRQMWGKSELKCDGESCKAEATAIIFPVLLHEVAKAAVEILLLQHLADVQEKHGEHVAKEVVKKADSYYDEHWLKLIGPRLWKYLHDALTFVVQEEGEDYTIIAYVLNRMASMEPEEFMSLIDDTVHNGPVAIDRIRQILGQIRKEIEDYEADQNKTPTPEELADGQVDTSDEISNLLAQNQDELLTRTAEEEKTPPKKTLADMNIDELNDELGRALEYEEYEVASKIRDEINRRMNG